MYGQIKRSSGDFHFSVVRTSDAISLYIFSTTYGMWIYLYCNTRTHAVALVSKEVVAFNSLGA